MRSFIKKFLADEDGPTVVEYSVMLALIVAVCMVAIGLVGTEVSTLFNYISANMP